MKSPEQIHLQAAKSCLLISIPHSGTVVPEPILDQFTTSAHSLPDTDWFVHRLYEWATELGAGMIMAPMSRYVIDLNRSNDDVPLYGKSETKLLTGLVPTATFSGSPVYLETCEPGREEIQRRVQHYWRPYHQCLREELTRIHKKHGFAIVLDAHSIRQKRALLFDGVLPDLNLGSNSGRSAAPSLLSSARAALVHRDYTMVVDGRFKGGYITRNYGQPANGIHALQLEMAQSIYMQEDPPKWKNNLAHRVSGVLKQLVRALMEWTPAND